MSKCLVLPREELESRNLFQSMEIDRAGKIRAAVLLEPEEVSGLFDLIGRKACFMERRGEDGVENKPEWQQVIFYGFVTNAAEFFIYKRGGEDTGNQETRLQSKLSAGVGGHIEPHDIDLVNSLYRELNEELRFSIGGQEVEFSDDVATVSVVGLIKDDTDAVGEVHLGMICLVQLNNSSISVSIKGEENVEGWFVDLAGYRNLVNSGEYSPENWTTLLMEDIGPKLLRAE